MSKRIIGVIVALVLAGAGTFVLVAWVQSAEDRALAGQETVDVLVVAEPITKGTAASDLSELVATERVSANVQAAGSLGSVDDLDDLEGQVAAVDLVPGEQVVSTRFVEPASLERDTDVEIPDELQEITISLSPERAVGGELQPGDTVGLFSSFENPPGFGGTWPDWGEAEEALLFEGASQDEEGEGEESDHAVFAPASTRLILHKVLVTNVQGDPAPDQSDDDEGEGDERGRNPAPGSNLLVTLAVDSAQAERIVFTAEFGSVWLSNEPESADEDGTEIQHHGRVYFE